MLRLLEANGLLEFNENSTAGKNEPPDPQRRAYQRARSSRTVMQSDYVCLIDGDEFFNIHAGDGTLDALLHATGPFDILSAPWRVFGSSGVVQFQDKLQMDQFNMGAKPYNPPKPQFWATKSIFRPAYTRHFGIHRPFLRQTFRNGDIGPLVWLNGSGDDIYEHFREGGWYLVRRTYGHKLVQVNHYMVRSAESFLMKQMRGTANTQNQDRINFDYFKSFDANDRKDDSILRFRTQVIQQIDEWFETLPGLKDLHEAGVAYHRAAIGNARSQLIAADPNIAMDLGFIPAKSSRLEIDFDTRQTQ